MRKVSSLVRWRHHANLQRRSALEEMERDSLEKINDYFESSIAVAELILARRLSCLHALLTATNDTSPETETCRTFSKLYIHPKPWFTTQSEHRPFQIKFPQTSAIWPNVSVCRATNHTDLAIFFNIDGLEKYCNIKPPDPWCITRRVCSGQLKSIESFSDQTRKFTSKITTCYYSLKKIENISNSFYNVKRKT